MPPPGGRVVDARDDPAALLTDLGRPTVLAELAVISATPGQPPVHTAALGPGGCYLSAGTPAAAASRQFHPVSAEELVQAVEQEVAAAEELVARAAPLAAGSGTAEVAGDHGDGRRARAAGSSP